jgi:hypothetical protein
MKVLRSEPSFCIRKRNHRIWRHPHNMIDTRKYNEHTMFFHLIALIRFSLISVCLYTNIVWFLLTARKGKSN